MITEEECDEIISFWFGGDKLYKEFWFDKSIDNIVSEKYKEMLKKLEDFKTFDLDYLKSSNFSLKYLISFVIIFDQFSRMIYRNENEKIKINDKVAFSISKFIFDSKKDISYPIEQRIFFLMLFRHSKTKIHLDFVLEKIKDYYEEIKNYSYEENKNEYVIFLDRFRLATYSSYTNLTDQCSFLYSLDKCEKDEKYDYSYLLENNLYSNSKNNKKSNLYDVLYNFLSFNNIENIGVSLSGGVDSMVILFLLSKLKNDGKLKNVYALHIEYGNRKESNDETDFLGLYCNDLKVPLFIRKIDYMKRIDVDRDFYEEETKKIRFNTYLFLSKKYEIKGWCLGHHNGDIVENVLMNIFNGRDILDLGVMKEISYIKSYDTYIYRPLINNSKEEIYQISKLFNIPYFKDSTPDWSGRGVLRRKILPNIESQWPSSKEKIINISKQSYEWNNFIEETVFKPLQESIIFNQNNKYIIIPIKDNIKKLPRVLWLNLFLFIFHKKGKKMISNKNLDYFINTLDRNIQKENKFMFSNKCIGSFKSDKLIIYLQ